jgi:hypothetical protein
MPPREGVNLILGEYWYKYEIMRREGKNLEEFTKDFLNKNDEPLQ